MVFGSNILSRYATMANVRKALVAGSDDETRLFISTVLASVWSEAEVEEFDPGTDAEADLSPWSGCDLLILDYQISADGDRDSGLNWLARHHHHADFPRTLIISAAGCEDIASRALQLGVSDCIPKGDDLSQRLLRAICGIDTEEEEPSSSQASITDPCEFFADSAALFDSNADSSDSSTLGNSSAMYIIKLDQSPYIKANKGQFYADKVGDSLHRLAKQWIKVDGANPARSMHTDAAVYIYATGMLGDIHSEMVAENICRRVRAGELSVDNQGLAATVSIGVCLEGEDHRVDITGYAALAESAVNRAEMDGGDGFKTATFSERRPAAVDSKAEDQESAAQAALNILALIKARRLSIGFERIIDSGGNSTNMTLQPKPSIHDENGRPCTYSRLATLFSTPGNATQLDRITLIQSIKLLQKKDPGKKSRILLDLSTESVCSSPFWAWLEQQLTKAQRGQQFIFNLSLDNFQARRISMDTIQRLTRSSRCQFAIRGLGDGLLPIKLALDLQLPWLVIDMEDDISNLVCEQISALISRAHKEQKKVVLRNVDSSDKLFCAYSSGADQLQGDLASQWESVELAPLDDPIAYSPQQTLARSA